MWLREHPRIEDEENPYYADDNEGENEESELNGEELDEDDDDFDEEDEFDEEVEDDELDEDEDLDFDEDEELEEDEESRG